MAKRVKDSQELTRYIIKFLAGMTNERTFLLLREKKKALLVWAEGIDMSHAPQRKYELSFAFYPSAQKSSISAELRRKTKLKNAIQDFIKQGCGTMEVEIVSCLDNHAGNISKVKKFHFESVK